MSAVCSLCCAPFSPSRNQPARSTVPGGLQAADVGSGKSREFTGLVDCISKTAKRAGPMGLYQGFGVSVQVGVLPLRCMLRLPKGC